jgi:hypothetical protein
MYDALNGLRIDPAAVYHVKRVRLQRDSISISLDEGTLGLFESYQGRVTGAVFLGRGHVVGIVRQASERESMAQFLGVGILDQPFTTAYLRFTDSTAKELLDQINQAGPSDQNGTGDQGDSSTQADQSSESGGSATAKIEDADLVAQWNQALRVMNPEQSLRIMADLLADQPAPYFDASLLGDRVGPFNIVVDDARDEQIAIGQTRWTGGAPVYDVWASFARANAVAPGAAFAPVDYNISTVIEADHTLEGTTTLTLRAVRGGQRVLLLELSRFLTVQSAEDVSGLADAADSGAAPAPLATTAPLSTATAPTTTTAQGAAHALTFFQNEALTHAQVAGRGNDLVYVVLPKIARAGDTLRLKLTYRGSVISDAGNGVLFVGERGSWYPHTEGFGNFTPYDLAFRWPRRLRLVATGNPVEQRDDGDWTIGRWHADAMNIAGFNLGEYSSVSVTTPDGVKIEVLANEEIEKALAARMRATAAAEVPEVLIPPPGAMRRPFEPPNTQNLGPAPAATPNPASQLHEVGQQIADAVHFEERWMGPLPFRNLEVSQIPGDFGQGWPGLLYLSTLAFLPPAAQQSAGVNKVFQEDFSEIMPFHEVGHQWWGNLIGWRSYRDQWIGEGMANYIALMSADARRPNEHVLSDWLANYRAELTQEAPGGQETIEESGALTLGTRLEASKNPEAYERITYGKGSWVLHMLRMMLRDPHAADPDARFTAMLSGIVASYTHRPFSTEDLQAAVERVMTPSMALEEPHSMAWFFDEWVYATGIPHYAVRFDVRKVENGWVVRGTLAQSEVPDTFLAPVPIYVQAAGGKPVLLGTVRTSGPQTAFRFVAQQAPRKLVIDPGQTLLCTHD